MNIYDENDIPAHLREYFAPAEIGLEETPQEYVSRLVGVFREVRRVLRDDGTLWLNLGDSYNNAGSSRNGEGLDGNRRGGATGAEGECGYKKRDLRRALGEIKCKDLVGIPWSVAFALRADGWYLRSDIIWHKPNPMPESVTDRPTKAHEYIFLLSKSERYWYDAAAIREPYALTSWTASTDAAGETLRGQEGMRSGAKGMARAEGAADGTRYGATSMMNAYGHDGRNKRSVWTVNPRPYPGAHFATFPPDLIEPCIKAGSRPGDLVLDPFNGSGTTGEVCRKWGRRYVGVELNAAYIDLSAERFRQHVLFPAAPSAARAGTGATGGAEG